MQSLLPFGTCLWMPPGAAFECQLQSDRCLTGIPPWQGDGDGEHHQPGTHLVLLTSALAAALSAAAAAASATVAGSIEDVNRYFCRRLRNSGA